MASRWHWIAVVVSSLGLSPCMWADPIGLLYPSVREPYEQVFLNIAEGAKATLGGQLQQQVVDDKTPASFTRHWIQTKGLQGLIVLGSNTVSLLKGSELKVPFVVGAVSAQAPDNYSSVSLNPSPRLLFAGLRALQPTVTTIHVVYDPRRNQWEVEQAEQMAEELQLRLISYPAEGLRHAARTYRDIQQEIDSGHDALWLPLGGPARDKSIMQNILETAWVKEQVVFSSNLADVKRGVLFAMYPDNVGMGRELAQLLQAVQQDPDRQPQTLFVQSLFKAVNRRTAEHLSIRLGNQELTQYDFVYPPR